MKWLLIYRLSSGHWFDIKDRTNKIRKQWKCVGYCFYFIFCQIEQFAFFCFQVTAISRYLIFMETGTLQRIFSFMLPFLTNELWKIGSCDVVLTNWIETIAKKKYMYTCMWNDPDFFCGNVLAFERIQNFCGRYRDQWSSFNYN